MLFGIPFVLPTGSATSCICDECGFAFYSEFGNLREALSPAEAASLDVDVLLDRTNPFLKERLMLAALGDIPCLSGALQLLERLRPGRLRTELKDALLRWPQLDEGRQERFLAKASECSEAHRCALLLASRHTTGAAGCVAGALGCFMVWAGCVLLLPGRLNLWGWVGVTAAGLAAGSLLTQLFWGSRDRRWVKGVLLPEARRSGIHLGALLAVLEGPRSPPGDKDELNALRDLRGLIREGLISAGGAGNLYRVM
jgi:hypothetical protein